MRAEVLVKSRYLTNEEIRSAHFEPINNIEDAVLHSVKKHGPDSRICVLPEGPQTIPYLANSL